MRGRQSGRGLGRAEVSLTIDNSAGLLPIDFSEVCITRALWRTRRLGVLDQRRPCRLLDIQELLSDTGVGRQQHTIVSQWQLDAVLSARPEDRRAVIEEAAGISKHRRRKEKAERRLEATEGALLRAQDLLKEVRRQLRPLERQAEAARRHAEVTDELLALRRHLYGRELALLGVRLGASGAARTDLTRVEEESLGALSVLDSSVSAAEEALDAAGRDAEESDLSELVSTAEGLKARAHGLVAVLQERSRGIERERSAAVDMDVVATLEAEAASLGEQLSATEGDAGELLPLEAELAAAEVAQTREAAETEERFGPRDRDDEGQVVAEDAGLRAGEVRAELQALVRSAQQADAELARLETRAEAVEVRRSRLAEEASRARAVIEEAESSAGQLTMGAQEATDRLAAAERGPPGSGRDPSLCGC